MHQVQMAASTHSADSCFVMQLHISYDSFIRTTDERHKVGTAASDLHFATCASNLQVITDT